MWRGDCHPQNPTAGVCEGGLKNERGEKVERSVEVMHVCVESRIVPR